MREDEARVQLQAAADAAAMRGSLLFHLQLAATLGQEALDEAGVAAPLTALLVDDEGYGLLALEELMRADMDMHVQVAVRRAGWAGLAFALKAWKGDVTRRLSVPHDARDIFACGGGIHCITQQIPAGATPRV